jgi:hypothetical protein
VVPEIDGTYWDIMKKIEDAIGLFFHEIQCNFPQKWTKHIDKFQTKNLSEACSCQKKDCQNPILFTFDEGKDVLEDFVIFGLKPQ